MLTFDSEISAAITVMAKTASAIPRLERGDWENRRAMIDQSLAIYNQCLPIDKEIVIEEFEIAVSDGDGIILRYYKIKNSQPAAALLYTHGGGKIAGTLDNYDALCKYYAAEAGVAVLSVGFRLAPEHPFPAPVEDSYAALLWLAEHAAELGLDMQRIGIAGDSGGGSFAAAVALMARDRNGPALAKQILIYPMLDDRNITADPLIEPYALWTYDDNYTGWQSFLGTAFGSDEVSSYAAPAREQNLTDLPPAYIEVGDLDVFRDESIAYASQLLKAGVSVELHVHAGAPHAFEFIAPDSALAQRAWQDRIRAVRSL